jgi:tetratricopeptide (TPR) repeat protein
MATISEALAAAMQHHQAGRLQAAEQIYRQILAVEPNQAGAWHLLGLLAYQAGRHEVAVEYIARAITLKDTEPAFHSNLGEAYRALRRIPEAVACYRRALGLKPDYAGAHNNLGIALMDQEQPDEAVACFRRALELKPDYVEAYNNLGNALKEQGSLEEAVACFRRALQCRPDFALAHNNLGAALAYQGRAEEAVACYRVALGLKPDYAEAHNNLGDALKEQGRLDEAAACLRRALELKPDFAEAHYNLGNTLKEQRRLDEAVACYRRALELKPDAADAHWNLALSWLLAGDWQRGWPEYQWRWQAKGCAPRRFPQPLWNGESLAAKTILLHAEQGLGDTIQFIRYAAIVKQHGGAVVVECQKPLVALLQGCPGIDRLVGQGDDLPAFDVQSPLLSVPGILKTSLETVPARIPYLAARPALVERWRTRLSGLDGFKIGIVWQGNPKNTRDRLRCVPLRCFAPLARIPGVRLLSLQKGAGAEQLAEVRDLFAVTDFAGELDEQSGPFMDTAALMKNLDLVIASDTAAAHLAGALGVPVWVALPFVPDWRWLLDRADSPWYPTMRLFRQERPGDWQGVFPRMESALRERI